MSRLWFVSAVAALVGAVLLADTPLPIPRDTLPADLPLTAPAGLDPLPAPKDNPLTPARVALGRRLFFDPILSGDGTIACVSCHHPDRGFSEAQPIGIHGQKLTRRAPPLLNRAYGQAFFWDGRSDSLEHQALLPIADPREMGSSVEQAVKRLQENEAYKKDFAAAFEDGVTAVNLARALAAFQRVLVRGNSKVDRFRKGEHDVLNESERHGMWLYESKGGCWRCHNGPNFSDEKFHNTGISHGQPQPDLGRGAITRRDEDRRKFKTPTLRGVVLSAPYMHDGSLKTLEDVVEYYSRGGHADPDIDPNLRKLNLSKEEIADLVAFLKAL